MVASDLQTFKNCNLREIAGKDKNSVSCNLTCDNNDKMKEVNLSIERPSLDNLPI